LYLKPVNWSSLLSQAATVFLETVAEMQLTQW